MASKRYPIDTPDVLETLSHWREDIKVDARRRHTAGESLPIVVTGFAENAEQYLEAVRAMPQFDQRRYHIRLWVELFGERDRTKIESREIRAQRDAWLMHGPKWVMEHRQRVLKPIPLSPQEVCLRLRALENMWSVMWPNEPNLVREVPEPQEVGEQKARGQTFALAREVLAHMPDLTTPTTGGAAEVGSLSRIRFETMLMTGLTHKQIGELDETRDVDYAALTITPPLRLKGRPSQRRARPRRPPRPRRFVASAAPVLKKFFAMGANKKFSRSSFWRTVKRAVRAANAERTRLGLPLLDETLRPYDWTRHTFGTEAARATRDPKAVQELMGHATLEQSDVYTRAAINERVETAVAELDKVARPAATPVRRASRGKYRGKVSPHLSPSPDRSPRLVKRQNTQ